MSLSFVIAILLLVVVISIYFYTLHASDNEDADGKLAEDIKKICKKELPRRMILSAFNGMIRGTLAGLILTNDLYSAYLSGIAFSVVNPLMLYLESRH